MKKLTNNYKKANSASVANDSPANYNAKKLIIFKVLSTKDVEANRSKAYSYLA